MKLTIRNKLSLSFSLIVAAFLAISFLFCYGLTWTNRTYAELVERVGSILNNARGIQSLIAQQNSNVSAYLLTYDIVYKSEQQQINESIQGLIEETERLISQEDDKRKLEYLLSYNRQYVQILDQVYATADADRDGAVREVKTKVIPFGEVMIDLSRQIADNQEQYMRREIERINAFANTLNIVSVSAAILVAAMAAVFSLVMPRRISGPLVALAEGARRISAGDLAMEDIVVKTRDEAGELARAFNQMKADLNRLARKLAESAKQVSQSAREFTDNAEQTAKATESIAEIMQKTAEGTDRQVRLVRDSVQASGRISGGIRAIVESASNTTRLSERTAEKASAGYAQLQDAIGQMTLIGGMMENLSGIMDRMKERSDRIGRFVTIISGISRQTKILSLNAAIVAARAKEFGRGFGVVAGEVRDLAAQTEEAARQAAELVGYLREDTEQVYRIVENGTRDVAEGIRSVNAAGSMFEEIKGHTEEVAVRIGGISSASEDISRQMALMAGAMNEIREVSETVADDSRNVQAAVEEQLAAMQQISSTAAALSGMSEELYGAAMQFKFGEAAPKPANGPAEEESVGPEGFPARAIVPERAEDAKEMVVEEGNLY